MFRYFKQCKIHKASSRELYERAVAQARLPVFYESLKVPDTVDGRFEMLALHCYIVIHRLQAAGEEKLSQALFDVFFITMDRSLREMGVGDLGVPKHMKRMMQGFNGRRQHYEIALKNKNKGELREALIRNVFGTVGVPDEKTLSILMSYIQESVLMDTIEGRFAEIEMASSRLRA